MIGWWNPNPYSSRKPVFHYIGEDGRALCGKWLYLDGTLEEGNDNHSQNCAACKRKKLTRPTGAEQAKETKQP